MTPEFVEQVRALIPEGSRPRIVPVLAREGIGDPFAVELSGKAIHQRNAAGRELVKALNALTEDMKAGDTVSQKAGTMLGMDLMADVAAFSSDKGLTKEASLTLVAW
ncbi:hypothetical protein [Azotobacter salinestris]|uniref:hypothetical protein n=1 Tax=Azotobacter salinestris TaxID=69964 RepID=UPI001266A0CF|nr:hypothetical protein [Azotobacter salinestris]